jgi:hypothetical protein
MAWRLTIEWKFWVKLRKRRNLDEDELAPLSGV